jgi:hypothetical protein
MKAATDNVWNKKMSVRQASEAYSVPKSSLHDRLMKLNEGKNVILAPDMGTFKRMFSDEQEELVACVKIPGQKAHATYKKRIWETDI